jgi:hypothetical protein
VDGKVDWMAYGLPVEGEDGPFIGDRVVEVPTCDVHGTVADVRPLLPGPVVIVADGLAVGEVEEGDLDGRADDEPLLDVMQPVPSTYRPSVTVEALAEDGGGGRHLVSTQDGRLLGAVEVEAHQHDHDHDHGDGAGGVDDGRFEKELTEVMEAVGERFGDREPTEGELRAFLRDRLVAEGHSAEDADRIVDQRGS